MEEEVLMKTKAGYFESATKLYNGELVLTSQRLLFSGEHERIQYDYGIGNKIAEKLENSLGYNKGVEHLIEIPIKEVESELKRFGFGKRLIVKDANGKVYKLQLYDKKVQPVWQEAIIEQKAK